MDDKIESGTAARETGAQRRYRADAGVLAEIGGRVAAQVEPVTVRIPRRLAAEAVRAWQRDETEPAGAETAEQAIVRAFAAALALIGVAVEERGTTDGDDVLVSLSPQQIAAALFAFEGVSDGHLSVGADPAS